MSELGIEEFHVAGNSLGGWVALEIASSSPSRVKSVIGLAPAGLWLNPYNVRYPATALARFLARSTSKLAQQRCTLKQRASWVLPMLALDGMNSHMSSV